MKKINHYESKFKKMKVQTHQTIKNSIFNSLLGIFTLLLFMNCSKDNPTSCLDGSWIQDVSFDLEKWTAAANTYGEEPTEENCNSYKSAINGYLNALDKIKKCVPTGSLADFNESLKEAKQELSENDCSGN